jgi:hypothetical protein
VPFLIGDFHGLVDALDIIFMADFYVGWIRRLDFNDNLLRLEGTTGRHGGTTDQEQTEKSNENPSIKHVETSYICYAFIGYTHHSKICTKNRLMLKLKIFV